MKILSKTAILLCIFSSFLSAQFQQENNNLNLQAGAISVTIGGTFIVTGTFPALISERVDQFITRMYSEARERTLAKAQNDPILYEKAIKELDKFSLRNLTLKRADGQEIILDIENFRRTGDFNDNPYLKNDDVLIFPPHDVERNFFTVSGAVNTPGRFHFMEGDNLQKALTLAGGINKAYEGIQTIEINRLSYDGEKLSTLTFSINSSEPLQRGDRIVVKADETQRREFSVLVAGEVKNAGIIPISKNNTTIKEVIEKAGGFTGNASLIRAKLYTGNSLTMLLQKRYNLKTDAEYNKAQFTELEEELTNRYIDLEKMLMLRMSNLTTEDTSYFNMENQLRVITEGSSVDFTQINDPNSEAAKYVVKDGDVIFIPQKQNSVYVFGQVAKQGRVAFEEGKTYRYYIEKAGGLGEFAIEDEIMVIKGESREWIDPLENNVILENGDYIYIPRERVRSFNQIVGEIGGYLSIVGSAATIILLLLQFTK